MTDSNPNFTNTQWRDNKTLVSAWLLAFFPVGLYALWRGAAFETKQKWQITAAVVVVFLLLGGSTLLSVALVFALIPAAIYLCWKDPQVSRRMIYVLAGWNLFMLVLLISNGSGGGYDDYGGTCSAVITEGNCTYYRDSDCNVIGRSCS